MAGADYRGRRAARSFCDAGRHANIWLNILFADRVGDRICVLVSLRRVRADDDVSDSQFIAPGRPDPGLLEAVRTNGVWLIVLVAAMAAFGFYASRAGEPLFGKLAKRRVARQA